MADWWLPIPTSWFTGFDENNPLTNSPRDFLVFLYLCGIANRRDGHTLQRGQCKVSERQIASAIGVTRSAVRMSLNRLAEGQKLAHQINHSNHHKKSVVTILNYDLLFITKTNDQPVKQPVKQPVTDQWTTSNRPVTDQWTTSEREKKPDSAPLQSPTPDREQGTGNKGQEGTAHPPSAAPASPSPSPAGARPFSVSSLLKDMAEAKGKLEADERAKRMAAQSRPSEIDELRAELAAETKPVAVPPPTSATGRVWAAYAEGFQSTYGMAPHFNGKQAGLIHNLIKRVGEDEAPAVAGWYARSPRDFYKKAGHALTVCISDAEKLVVESRAQMPVDKIADNVNMLRLAARLDGEKS